MKRLFCNGQPIQCKNNIGEGQEAVVYRLSPTLVAKIYRQPDDESYRNNIHEQTQAKVRLQHIAQKLRSFPKITHPYIITPKDVITDSNGNIVGYTMPYIDQAQQLLLINNKLHRGQAGINNNTIMNMFQELHQEVSTIHKAGALIGDFNDMNVLIKDNHPYVIDTDSWQFGKFLCRMYTDKYVDPLLCNTQKINGKEVFALDKPHNIMSDWYAFTSLLWTSLLYIPPYGGTYKPSDPKKAIKQDMRASKRITAIHPDVIYPKFGNPFIALPKNMQDWMMDVYTKDTRAIFPMQLLHNVHWQQCDQCGIEHATPQCPICHAATYLIIPQQIAAQGVKVQEILRTKHTILYATIQNDTLLYAYTDGHDIYRENDMKVAPYQSKYHSIIRFTGNKTYVASNGIVLCYEPYKVIRQTAIDMVGTRASFDAHMYGPCWVAGGEITREKPSAFGTENSVVGHGIEDQTIITYQHQSGIGIARAGNIYELYIISAGQSLLVRRTLSNIVGNVIDVQCYSSATRHWILLQTKQQATMKNMCICIDQQGIEITRHECDTDDASWLGTIYGKVAFGNNLFSPTDEGIVAVKAENNTLATTLYKQTASYVHSHCQLLASSKGIYVVTDHTIKLLSLQ